MNTAVEGATVFDTEFVDILSIGSGSAGLAAAIAASDTGLSVFVAEPHGRTSPTGTVTEAAESWAAQLQRSWGAEELDGPTSAYLRELTCELGPVRRSQTSGRLPTATVESSDGPIDRWAPVPPFHGGQIANWARACLASPYGLVSSRLSPLARSEMRLEDGTSITAGVVADIPTARRTGLTLRQWLGEMAEDRGVKVHGYSTIQRLLFHDGQPVGAMVETPDGVRQVRARQGVLLGTGSSVADDLLATHPASILRDGRLALVSRNASRFARLELLFSAESMSLCAPAGQLA